ncbi:MAG: hypothetical protein ACKOE9_06625, partial [Vulcanococcus sp.]
MTLLLLVLIPVLAGCGLQLLPAASPWVRRTALSAAAAQLATAVVAWRLPPADLSLSWLPKLGLRLDLGMDGLSLPLVLLAALITAMAVLATPLEQQRARLFYGPQPASTGIRTSSSRVIVSSRSTGQQPGRHHQHSEH